MGGKVQFFVPSIFALLIGNVFYSYSPVWKIGKHFKWAPKLISISEEYLMQLFNVLSKNEIPHASLLTSLIFLI